MFTTGCKLSNSNSCTHSNIFCGYLATLIYLHTIDEGYMVKSMDVFPLRYYTNLVSRKIVLFGPSEIEKKHL